MEGEGGVREKDKGRGGGRNREGMMEEMEGMWESRNRP